MTEPVIDSRAGFRTAVAWGIHEAIASGARRIVCADDDFNDWPWDEPAMLDALGAWLRQPQRRLELLARHYEELARGKPRFNNWRRDWSHAIHAWQLPDDWTGRLPSVLVADRPVSVHLIDKVHWRGAASTEASRAQHWVGTLDAVLQRCEGAFAVRTLGL